MGQSITVSLATVRGLQLRCNRGAATGMAVWPAFVRGPMQFVWNSPADRDRPGFSQAWSLPRPLPLPRISSKRYCVWKEAPIIYAHSARTISRPRAPGHGAPPPPPGGPPPGLASCRVAAWLQWVVAKLWPGAMPLVLVMGGRTPAKGTCLGGAGGQKGLGITHRHSPSGRDGRAGKVDPPRRHGAAVRMGRGCPGRRNVVEPLFWEI